MFIRVVLIYRDIFIIFDYFMINLSKKVLIHIKKTYAELKYNILRLTRAPKSLIT